MKKKRICWLDAVKIMRKKPIILTRSTDEGGRMSCLLLTMQIALKGDFNPQIHCKKFDKEREVDWAL